jgi:hypothetical protein
MVDNKIDHHYKEQFVGVLHNHASHNHSHWVINDSHWVINDYWDSG